MIASIDQVYYHSLMLDCPALKQKLVYTSYLFLSNSNFLQLFLLVGLTKEVNYLFHDLNMSSNAGFKEKSKKDCFNANGWLWLAPP